MMDNRLVTQRTDDWREALDSAEAFDHHCMVAKVGSEWRIDYFDNPHALYVTELGHVEEVELCDVE